MSGTAKAVWAIVVIIVLGGIAYWYWSGNEGASTQYGGAAMSTSSPQDTSDAALNQDQAAIDAQFSAAASDSATANSSLNDKPIAQ